MERQRAGYGTEGVVSELDADNNDTNQVTTKANAEGLDAHLRFSKKQVAFKNA